MIIKLKKSLLLTGLIIILAGTILFVPAVSVLTLKNRKNPSERYYSVKAVKNGFCISYTHSVNKGRVHDYYKCLENGSLMVDRTVVVSYGAGIPEPEETPGANFTVLDDGYQIGNLNRIVPRLMMAVGIVANHSITIDENEYFLTDYFKPQTSLYLETRKISVTEYFLHKLAKKNQNK